MKRNICVVTGSRADYGLLRSVMQEIELDSSLNLQLIVTGMHLSPEFGLTHKEIEFDGFEITKSIPCLSKDNSAVGIAHSMAKVISGCADAFLDLKPDLILLLGDRFEIFAAASAAHVAEIPIAHIHGGEKTVGSLDEAFRHSITKMAHIHFVAADEYARRVIQLGENSKNVHNFGAVGIDDILNIKLFKREDLKQLHNVNLGIRNLLINFHPATFEGKSIEEQTRELLKALDEFKDVNLIFTGPNADRGGTTILKVIEKYVSNRSNAQYIPSMGRRLYLSCLAVVDGVVGNSSSGILEAPSFKVGTVNIGRRQLGRIFAKSVVSVDVATNQIVQAINQILSADFRMVLKDMKNPYGEGGASAKIVEVIKNVDLTRIVSKSFCDFTCCIENNLCETKEP